MNPLSKQLKGNVIRWSDLISIIKRQSVVNYAIAILESHESKAHDNNCGGVHIQKANYIISIFVSGAGEGVIVN